MDGDVMAVRAVEFGADMNGSWMSKSCGETVPILVVELDALAFRSNTDGIAGEEYAEAEAPPSNPVKSSRSTS
jgi:hypothetical protein